MELTQLLDIPITYHNLLFKKYKGELEMTTRILVDAHAGWPVQVVGIYGETHKEVRTDIVLPFTSKDFYIHSGYRIISIEELPK
jgi:hypothetical protein